MSEDVKCPICGSETVERTVKKGPNAGNSFYLCNRYPECNGKVAIRNQEGDETKEGARGTSRKAISSMCFGLIGLLLCWMSWGIIIFPILSFLFARRFRLEWKKDKNLKGNVYAYIGVIASVIALLFWLIAGPIGGTGFVF